MARKVEVDIVGDASSLERAYRKAKVATRGFQADMKRLSRSPAVRGGGLLGGAGAIVGLERAVSAASDLSEQVSKTNVVFGQSASDITDWAQTTSTAFGISRRQALATASSFGALFKPIGIVGAGAADQSRKLTELGADLASFYNTDVQDALDALRSGIIGEAEPLRRYGVLLSETRVQQEALAETHKATAGQLSAQEKAVARITLIFKDAKTASGDFAKTSEDLANQTRILQANLDNLKVKIGTRLLPVVNAATGALNDMFEVIDRAPSIGTDTFKRGERVETTLVPALARQIQAMKKAGTDAATILKTLRRQLGGSLKADDLISEAFVFSSNSAASTALKAKIKKAVADAAKTVTDAADDEKRKIRRATAEQRNTWFDAIIGRELTDVQDIPTIRGQIARLKEISAQITARIAVTKDITRKKNLEDTLKDNARQRRSLLADLADQARAAREAAAFKAEAARQAAIDTRMGWLDFAVEKADATKPIKDNVKAQQDIISFLTTRMRQEGRTLELVRGIWEARQKIKDLNKSKGDVDPLAGLMQVSSSRLAGILAAGTGLGPAGRRILGANIAGAEIQPIHVHSTVVLDGEAVGRSVTRHQARSTRRTAQQTSGHRG